jgi:hypothetical protein
MAKRKCPVENNPIRILAIDDKAKAVLAARAGELDFQFILHQHMSSKAKAAMTPSESEKRRRSALDSTHLDKLIAERECKVDELSTSPH